MGRATTAADLPLVMIVMIITTKPYLILQEGRDPYTLKKPRGGVKLITFTRSRPTKAMRRCAHREIVRIQAWKTSSSSIHIHKK